MEERFTLYTPPMVTKVRRKLQQKKENRRKGELNINIHVPGLWGTFWRTLGARGRGVGGTRRALTYQTLVGIL